MLMKVMFTLTVMKVTLNPSCFKLSVGLALMFVGPLYSDQNDDDDMPLDINS